MDFHKKGRFRSLWLPLIFAIFTYCIGDVLLKKGNIEIGSTLPSLFQITFWSAFISNLPIISAFVCALTSKLIMGYVLSRNPLGLSEGLFLALSVILTFILGIIIFNELVTWVDIVAICTISLGILLIYSNES